MIRDALNVVQSAFQTPRKTGPGSVLSLSSSSSMPSFQPTLSETPRRRCSAGGGRGGVHQVRRNSSYPVEHQQAHWADLADRRSLRLYTFAVPSTSVRGLNSLIRARGLQ